MERILDDVDLRMIKTLVLDTNDPKMLSLILKRYPEAVDVQRADGSIYRLSYLTPLDAKILSKVVC